ncbi:hypothetical protein RND71_018378 [Anisodus tanguticus]|uniref:Uncharacterized protein n=1 Tax=Anisodus tanguticus TaxID=243964 RepID=A0AAE1S5H8_9SOLA|nr:hypothetical protein RND71_018378 [Anisodus tanguticus]
MGELKTVMCTFLYLLPVCLQKTVKASGDITEIVKGMWTRWIEDNDSLLANGGGGECEDSDRSFIGGTDPYLDNEDEGLNLMCVEKEVNIHDQREEDEEDHMPYQDEYEDHVTDEDENGEGINEETFTHEQFLQGPIKGM